MLDTLKNNLPPEALKLIEKHPTINTPEKFLSNALKTVADLMQKDLDGNEVLVGKDGKYERYQWK
jgi:hypothetical protein|tara:strand:- start:2065 stop:2259 length:195 start_codon:yes stop_codon:yes gene_type:complete